jgi:DNA (cytosine-5)-methyltransferase 1
MSKARKAKKPVRPRGGSMKWDVCELFAGVGGFRIGLEAAGWEVKFSSQWEPGAKKQHASDCYVRHFGPKGHSNDDIAKVTARLKAEPDAIPDHDLLVGGFPCQDYSVATTQAKGIEGKKGVLWWEINKILQHKRPRYALLENVDRLLTSPSSQRGRDFAVILACFRDNGYAVEWRMINAAEAGFHQKRRRTFIFAAHLNTPLGKRMMADFEPARLLEKGGLFATAFPVEPMLGAVAGVPFDKTLQQVSDTFSLRFGNAGIMLPGRAIWTTKAVPRPVAKRTLGEILEKGVGEEYYVDQSLLWNKGASRNTWEYVKGAKREERQAKNGFKYAYTEGAIPFPDALDQPSRTILTGDGNRRPNRITHIIRDPWTKKYRVLSPLEMERLNGFPDNWTEGMPLSRRYFCMGNALVVGIVARLGNVLVQMVKGSQVADQVIREKELVA